MVPQTHLPPKAEAEAGVPVQLKGGGARRELGELREDLRVLRHRLSFCKANSQIAEPPLQSRSLAAYN